MEEDDLTFGASVWGSSEPAFPPPASTPSFAAPEPEPEAATFDDFDDFGSPTETTMDQQPQDGGFDDDDFGDFGDEVSAPGPEFSQHAVFEQAPIAGPSEWQPLRLAPIPNGVDLREQVDGILGPIWADHDISKVTTNEGIREVEGISQILVYPESRELYTMLFQSPPPTKPPNWTRSRIRRQHLISLGVPVNLDEVLPPQANGKPMPALQVTTRPMSAPPGPRPSVGGAASPVHRSGTPQDRGRSQQFGPKPEIDDAKIAHLLALDAETLAIQPLSTLEGYLAALRAQTATTSALLSHLLQTRESLQQDSETYNKLIAELVSEAQKVKTVKGRTPSRRGTGT
ncbi:hypothetical protein FB45DRAFT_418502 [Roridomyces roridus]|uniref:Uncharacterized protein n=1 Tax=Roridomyces roridus TaxID=1738132 RepID=A0AAD7C557_9AGAR|nr:hypothetical protein FB45DRAFT_418502 [Roridomyces roridus]